MDSAWRRMSAHLRLVFSERPGRAFGKIAGGSIVVIIVALCLSSHPPNQTCKAIGKPVRKVWLGEVQL